MTVGTRLGVLVGGTRYGLPTEDSPQYCLDLLDLDRASPEDDPARITLDFLPHGLSVHPQSSRRAVVFEKHGPGACHLDLVAGESLGPIQPVEGHHFYGHGAYSRDGDALFAVETDLATGEGIISIRDPETFSPIGRFPTFGKAPHDCQLIEDGSTLVITNGGGTMDSSDRASVAFVDVSSHKLLEQRHMENPRINAGHIALTRLTREFAVVSAPRSGLPADVTTGGLSLSPQGKPMTHLTEPRAVTDRFIGESLSVCIHEPTRRVVATHPFGHVVTIWNLDSQTIVAALDLPNPRGVTLTLDGGTFAISYGPTGTVLLLDAVSLRPLDRPRPGRRCFGGSHIYSWAHPA